MLSTLVPFGAIFGFLIAKIVFTARLASGKDVAKTTKLAIESVISIAFLALGILVVVYDPQNKHWAYAAGGVVVGYWLAK